MKQFTLYLGSAENDEVIKEVLEAWCSARPDISLKYESIHINPGTAVRLGITQLPALVTDEQLVVQGGLENWITAFLNRLYGLGSEYDTNSKQGDMSPG